MLKRLVKDDAAFHVQARSKEIPVLKFHISVIYYLYNVFTNANDPITCIYISFLIGGNFIWYFSYVTVFTFNNLLTSAVLARTC